MSGTSSLSAKHVYTEVCNLKRLDARSDPKFKLETNPFDEVDDDADELQASAALKEKTITGRVYPDSDIYKEGSYRIEMKLISTFPFDPPEVRFLTKIYHPNVDTDGNGSIAKSSVRVIRLFSRPILPRNIEENRHVVQ